MAGSLYQPLNPETKEIRLFDLSPGQEGDPLSGRLRVVSLDCKPKYDALSYVWGPPEPQTVIKLEDEHSLSVGPNLRLPLVDLRHKSQSRNLWIDAVCIDQQNDDEKGHQIRMMSQVYSEARVTRAWLNHEVDLRNVALRALPKLVEKKEVRKGEVWIYAYSWRDTILSYLRIAQKLESHDWSFWMPAIEIFQNEYWSRVWIQQELIISREVRFHLRTTEIPGNHIFRFHDIVVKDAFKTVDHDHPIFNVPMGYFGFYRRDEPQDIAARRKNSRTPLISLIYNKNGLKSSNPLDMVYGCLALANQLEISTLVVDYSLSLAQVFTNVIRSHIIHWKNLEFLLFTALEPCVGCPTWLPTREHRPSFLSHLGSGTPELDWLTTPASVSDDGLHLVGVQARYLDTIAEVSGVTDPRSASVRDILQAISQCWLKVHPEAEKDEVWASDSLIGVLKWRHPLGGDMPPLDGTADILRDTLEFTKTSPQQTNFGFSAALDILKQSSPTFSESRITAIRSLANYLSNFIPVMTKASNFGFVSWTNPERKALPGDQVWLVAGCSQPVVLRKQGPGSGQFSVIGPILFAESMDGQNTRASNHFRDQISNGKALEDFTERITLI